MTLTPELRHKALELAQGRLAYLIKALILSSGVTLKGKEVDLLNCSVNVNDEKTEGRVEVTFRLTEPPPDEWLETLVKDDTMERIAAMRQQVIAGHMNSQEFFIKAGTLINEWFSE